MCPNYHYHHHHLKSIQIIIGLSFFFLIKWRGIHGMKIIKQNKKSILNQTRLDYTTMQLVKSKHIFFLHDDLTIFRKKQSIYNNEPIKSAQVFDKVFGEREQMCKLGVFWLKRLLRKSSFFFWKWEVLVVLWKMFDTFDLFLNVFMEN